MEIVNRQKLYLLARLAKAEGHLAAEEKELIHEVGLGFGMSRKDVDEIIDNPGSLESLGALSREQKKEYFLDCIRMVMADGRIEDRELTFSQNVAVKLGFNKDVVSFAINNIHKEDIDLSDYYLPTF